MVEFPSGTLDAAYAALSNNARRAIVRGLLGGEQRVTDIARPFDMSLAAVSKHIRVLEGAGIVRRRVDGRIHWLSLEPGPLAAAGDWIEKTRSFWDGRIDALEALVTNPGGRRS